MKHHTTRSPRVAIIDSNTLSVMGLKQLLLNVMPIMEIDVFASYDELMDADPESYFHYFVSTSIVLAHRRFFSEHQRKTIVLAVSDDPGAGLSEFHSLYINQPEAVLVRSLLSLEQRAHAGGRHLPPMPKALSTKILSDREIEVLSLIVQGYINKEIADMLHIGMTTVVTHRKNIMEKLGMRSVSALTIYAVMHGYVDINKI